ncbi:unnamed protein product [Ranitomeya imitator]|uniref:Platelet-derived growth factor receptor-like protein n=1 Tax=Ranitomeya imitator TaxID=111125 RepID=A0ABN9LKR3_9NEOB|nr:unnamed protein product [Ranitomeya imitator]
MEASGISPLNWNDSKLRVWMIEKNTAFRATLAINARLSCHFKGHQDGNQGKHRVTKRGPALSYPMFTLVTSEDIAGSVSHTPIQRCQEESSDEIKFWTFFSDQRSIDPQQGPDPYTYPTLSVSGRRQLVNAGSKFIVSCKDSNPVEWYHQKLGYLKARPVSRSQLQSFNDGVNLLISQAERRHVGKYSCFTKGIAPTDNQTFYLFVKDSSNPFFDIRGYYDVKEGSDISGICFVSDSEVSDYSIRKCDKSSLPEGFVYESNIETGITIKNVQRNFIDCYMCSVNHAGVLKTSQTFRLVVTPVQKLLPLLSLTKSRLVVKAGEPFEVTCVVKDVNIVEVNWIDAPTMLKT